MHLCYCCPLLFTDGKAGNLTNNGRMDGDVLKTDLLAAYNFIQGTSLNELGAGEVATEIFMGLAAQVIMEVRRFLAGDNSTKPKSGKGGNALASKGVELEMSWKAAYDELDDALRVGVCLLEASGEVVLMRSRTLSTLRALRNALSEQQQKQLHRA